MSETSSSADAFPARDDAGRDPGTDLGSCYGERYYLTDYTVPYGRNEHWLQFFGHVAERLVADLSPRSALDAGCAMGLLVEQLVMRGVDSYGIDISEFAISHAPESVRDRVSIGSLTKPLPRRYDLITCIEVLEHMPPDESRTALANLCGATDLMLFSSVPDGFEEPTHVNVQPPEAWSAWFAEHGFFRVIEYDASYLAPWAVLYERRVLSLPEVVRSYDRSHARLRTEVQQLRSSILRLAEQLQEASPGASEAIAQQEAEREATTKAFSDLEEQLLAMRDIVVGLEAEVGEAKGQRDVYAAQTAAMQATTNELQSVLRSRAWRLTRRAAGPYHRLRRFFRA